MLEISDLVCRYGKVEAIKGISLSINQGQDPVFLVDPPRHHPADRG